MSKYILSLDQGTTSSRCIIFDHNGSIVSSAQREFTQIYPHPGWVEHNPDEIWSSQFSVISEALGLIGSTASDIAGIGITNQRETTIIWNKHTGIPIYNAIVWQCRRTSQIIDQIKADGHEDYIKNTTGLLADAYFSCSKIKWILDNVDGARDMADNGDLLFGTVDTWLMWKLSNGTIHATDYTNASRTMLFNINTLEWDNKMLDILNIPSSLLPEVKPSSCIFGYTSKDILGASIPISGVAGDQQAALFGQCCFDEGSAKNTYGTGCFLLMNTGSNIIQSQHGLITTIAASVSDNVQYALEGSVFVAGAAIQWLRDELRMIKNVSETEEIAESVSDTNGMYIVPAFTGLGAPYWNQYARGSIFGLTRGIKKEHFVRATLESLAYQTYDVLKAMELDSGIKLISLNVDGGASNNGFLMQFQSDILETPVIRPAIVETTALGAAYLSGLSIGYWNNIDEIRSNRDIGKTFSPVSDKETVQERINGWLHAIDATNYWAK